MEVGKTLHNLMVVDTIKEARLNKINVLCVAPTKEGKKRMHTNYTYILNKITEKDEFEITDDRITDKVSGSIVDFKDFDENEDNIGTQYNIVKINELVKKKGKPKPKPY